MGYNLLTAAGPGVTSKWIWTLPTKDVGYPIRVILVPHNWSAGNVIIEELTGGTPGNGAGSPYPPQTDTGNVLTVATAPAGAADLVIEAPVEYLRARTDANVVGTVDVNIVMDS